MAATINTNIASINAQRNLALSGQSLNTTMQRLSSGLRVNSAKDDAAGLAIAERMNTQVKGLTVAARNANDGISLAQTAEGALGKVGDMLQRMRELAVQASNATNSDSDRAALQAEVSQLAAEIDRVAKQTNFNGQKILDGSFAGAVFQVGANSGDNVTLGALADTRSSKISLVNYAQNTVTVSANDNPTPAIKDYAVAIPAGELKITIGSSPAQTIELEAIKEATSSLERLGQVVTAINNKAVDTGVTAYMSRDETTGDYKIELMAAKTNAEGTPFSVNFGGFNPDTTGIGGNFEAAISEAPMLPSAPVFAGTTTDAPSSEELTAWDEFINTLEAIPAAGFTGEKLDERIAALTSALNGLKNPSGTPNYDALKTAVTDALTVATTPAQIELTPTGIESINELIAAHNLIAAKTPGSITSALSQNSPATAFESVITELEVLGIDVTATTPTFNLSTYATGTPVEWIDETSSKKALDALTSLVSQVATNGLDFASTDHQTNQRGLDNIDVTTQEGAWIALKKIDSAIDQINGARATLGAMQTRFETAVNNIDIQVENLSAARGRIVDADFAVETANLSRTQILQQAGTAMVAQANQIPQNVLQLLQG